MSFNQNYVQYDDGFRSYLNKTFLLMGAGLLVTAAAAFGALFNIMSGGIMYRFLISGSFTPLLLCIVQLGVVMYLNMRIASLSPATARVLFFVYAGLTGVNFGSIALFYGVDLMFMAFAFAAVLFISCAVIGYTTQVDLTRFSGLFMGGLIAILLVSVVSMFFRSFFWGMNLYISYFGILLFLGITAWDVQKLKHSYNMISYDAEFAEKYSIIAALQLYLDFINIFLYIVRILGNSRNRR